MLIVELYRLDGVSELPRKNNRLTTVSTALSSEEVLKIRGLAQAKNQTISELFREGMQWYLANQDKLSTDSRETLLEKRMKKMEDRMAALMVRTAIDVGMVFNLMYRNMDPDKRADAVAWAYNGAVERLRKKLGGQAAELKDIVKEADDTVGSKAQLHKGKKRQG